MICAEKLKKLYKLKEKYIYYILGMYFFSLFIYNTCLETSVLIVSRSTKVIRYLCYLIFIFSNILDFIKDKKISCKALIFFAVAVFIAFFAKNNEIIFIGLVLHTVKDMDYKKIIKMCLYIYAICFSIIIIFSLLEIIPDWTYTRGKTIRHSLGFYYATSTISILLLIVLMYFYIRRTDFNYLELTALEVINIFIYKYTDGRLGGILITSILLIMAISKIKIIKKIILNDKCFKLLKFISYVIPTFLFCIMIILSILYAKDLKIINDINELLSQRIKWSYNAIQKYPVKLFGNDIEWVGFGGQGYVSFEQKAYNYVDSAYIKIIFDYGIVGTFIILYMYTRTLIKSINERDYYLYFTLIFILIWSLIEPYIFNMSRNIFIIAFAFIFNEKCINLENVYLKYKNNIKNKPKY